MKSDSLRLAAVEAQVRRLPSGSIPVAGPTFLTTSMTVLAATSNAVAWQTFNASDFVPTGTRTAIIETEWSLSQPDTGDVDASIRFRQNIDSGVILGSRGRAAGGSDNIAGANQLMVPLTANGSFDYMIEDPGFNNGATIRLIGYVA